MSHAMAAENELRGRRPLYLIAISGFLIGSVLCGAANS